MVCFIVFQDHLLKPKNLTLRAYSVEERCSHWDQRDGVLSICILGSAGKRLRRQCQNPKTITKKDGQFLSLLPQVHVPHLFKLGRKHQCMSKLNL